MGSFATYILLIGILYSHQEYVACQSTEVYLFDANDVYTLCDGFDGMPTTCSTPVSQGTIFPSITANNLGAVSQNCGENYYGYQLFDSDQIFRVTLPITGPQEPVPVLAEGITAITTFAICCDRIFFASGDTVYVQNLEGEPRIRKTLYQATGTISKIDVCCNNDNFNILHMISGDGVYSVTMDGRTSIKILNNNAVGTITAFDVNCGIEQLALAAAGSMYVWDFGSVDPSTFPVDFGSLTPWETRTGETANDVSLAAAETTLAPNVLTAWSGGSGPGYALTYTTASGVSSPITGTIFDREYQDIALCLDEQDCALGCPAATTCPCDANDDFQSCCNGLCVQRTEVDNQEYACFCSDEELFTIELCSASDSLPPTSLDCPLDLIGAVKCQGGNRYTSSAIYALSVNSLTSICAADLKGNDQSMPLGSFPFRANGMRSSAYLFKGPTNFNDYHGNRYGLYRVQTTRPGLGEAGEEVDSFPVIVQERSDALSAEYITVSANVDTEVTIQLSVARYCNTRRVRWRKNGKFLRNYNGKVAITFDRIKPVNEGIYEVYLQGRIKRDWRRIIRVIVRSDSCGGSCVANGGVCSYSGSYCICPPGRVGAECETDCEIGTFGLRGKCEFSCQEEFGDECSDCQYVLFCMEDPFGCQCYPGYEQPNCSACPTGYYGLGCQGECNCIFPEVCNPYDGSCS